MWSKEREEQVKDLCVKLVRQESVSGNEKNVVEELKKFFDENGFDGYKVDKYGSIVGYIKGKRPGKKVLFDGHVDEVPISNPSAWTHDPFGGEICDGKIFSRGTSDMKGAVSAAACAAVNFAKDCDRDFAGEILVSGVVHEECFEGIGARQISADFKPDYVIIGESTNLNLRVGQRGRAEIVVETFGKPAHSANPEKGINAVLKMYKVIEAIGKMELTSHPKLGKGIMALTDIKSAPYPGASVIPDYCRATYDRRLLVGETEESVLKPLQAIVDKLMAEDKELKAKVSYAYGKEMCYTGETIEGHRFFPGWLYDEDEDYVVESVKELKAAGFNPEISVYNFCTNGSHYGGEAKIKVLGCGPSQECIAHTDDEYIELEQLYGVTKCYMAIAKALLK